MITTFWLLALALCLVAAGFILLPLYLSRRREAPVGDRTTANVDIYEERLAELRASLETGEFDQAEFELQVAELKKNLLHDAGDTEETARSVAGIGRLPIVLAVLVPVFALFAYSNHGLSWGAIDAVQLAHQLSHTNPHNKAAMTRDIERLAVQMNHEPANDQGWFLLAQSYMDMKLYNKAARTFVHLIHRYPQDDQLASYYMQAVYLADQRQITPRVKAAIDTTLRLNPHDISALEILAMDAFSKSDFASSLDYFRKALVGNPDKARRTVIEQAIAGVEKTMRSKGMKVPPPPAQSAAPPMGAIAMASAQGSDHKQGKAAHRSLDVLVEVGRDVKVADNASVFVFAKAVNGPPMPLAVKRMSRSDLPKLVKLDDTMGMIKGMSLDNFNKVEVVARISSSGMATASPDDYEARSGIIDLTKPQSVITLKIVHRRKQLASN